MLAVVCAVLSLCVAGVRAQPRVAPAPAYVFQGVSASDALARLASSGRADVVFSTDLVGDAPVWCGGPGWAMEDLLRCITDASGLDFVRRSTGTYVVVERVVTRALPGTFAGLVVDGETGEPLSLAHVRLADAAAVTDPSGHFSISSLAPGPHVVTASYVGYQASAVRVSVAPGGTTRETLALAPVVLHAGTVVVNGLTARSASETLGADMAQAVWNRAGDVAADAEPGPSLASSGPAATSSIDGAALRPLLGVSGRTFRDGLSLQGGERGEHVLTIDGAKVYEPLSVGPALGAMAPLAVGRLTVHKGGFGVRHGSKLSGVLDARHRLGRPAGRWIGAAAEADAYAASGRLQHHLAMGPVAGEPASLTTMLAGRRSLWDLRRPAALDQTLRDWNAVDPVLASVLDADPQPASLRPHYTAHRHGSDLAFDDLHAAARLRIGPLHQLQGSFYRGRSSIQTQQFAVGAPLSPDASSPDPAASLLARDGTRWTNLAHSLRAEAFASARWRLGGGVRYSHHTLRQRYDALDGSDIDLLGTEDPTAAEARLVAALDAVPRPDDGNDLREIGAEADATVSFGTGHEATFGADAARYDSRFHLLSAGFGETAFRDLDAARTSTLVATYVDLRYRLGSRWVVEPGLRLTTRTASGDVISEPRLALRYDALPEDRLGPLALGGVSARLAAGVYRQFTSRLELATFGPSALVPDVAVWLPIDETLDPSSALHLAGEALWQPSDRWSVRLEGYAKAMPRVYALDYAVLLSDRPSILSRQADFLLAEEGRSLGVGVRAERQATRWAAHTSLSLSNTERRSDRRFEGRWTAAPWEEPVRATAGLDVLLFGSRSGTGLLLRTRGLGIWGRSWALRRAYYDVVAAQGTDALGAFRLDRPGADQLAPLLQLDLGASYSHALGDGRRAELALDVENVLDRQNVLDWSLRPDGEAFGAVTRTLPGIQPSIRLRVTL